MIDMSDFLREQTKGKDFYAYLIFNCGEYFIYKKDKQYYVLTEKQMTCETFGDKTWLDDYEFVESINMFFRTREENVYHLFPDFSELNFIRHKKYRLETAKVLADLVTNEVINSIVRDFIKENLNIPEDGEINFNGFEPDRFSLMQAVREGSTKLRYDMKRKEIELDEFGEDD